MEFDEQNAIKYIREHLPAEFADAYDDDEILNVIDIIFDYYEDNGLLDIDFDDDEDEVDADALVQYVVKMLKKDKASPIKPEHIQPIVLAELEYEQSLDF
jgi:hypothetical protein